MSKGILREPYCKKIDRNLFELRILDSAPIRILYMFHNTSFVLLHAFIKKSNKISKNHLSTGKRLRDILESL